MDFLADGRSDEGPTSDGPTRDGGPNGSGELIDCLAEEFIIRLRRGERPEIDEYCRRYPTWATRIRDLFPTLLVMERLKPVAGDSGSMPHGDTASPIHDRQLGDFRLIREIAHGGMGTVYEAEQLSLRRRVALKVLAGPYQANECHRRRFEVEARAAARLHHTNIVPVFGVSEHEGVVFYVMQFIHGLGLDQVLTELRRMRLQDCRGSSPGLAGESLAVCAAVQPPIPSSSDASHEATSYRDETADLPTLSAKGVAASLLTGVFRHTEPALSQEPDQTPAQVAKPTDSSGFHENHAAGRGRHLGHESGTSLHLRDSGSSGRGRTGAYWRSIARIGVQVADALHYAHVSGVVHRDIKPGNLLLDTHGTVWVTDFGVAKSSDEDQGLTRTGDVLGTLRYMSPEQIAGKCTPRSDVYSLGVTLYELLTLRPAFDEPNRRALIHQVVHTQLTLPRQIDPAIPEDLQTIVLKAADVDPARRYVSAAEMRDDLQRFLEGRPIRARRISAVDRVIRWAKRNPSPASLLMLLIAIAVCSPFLVGYFGHLARHAREAERSAEVRLHEALLATANAKRFGRRPGQHFETLEALAEAAKLHHLLGLDPSDREPMRADAIAALALPDLQVRLRWPVPTLGKLSMADFQHDLSVYSVATPAGLEVRRTADNELLSRLPTGALSEKARFSPDGRLLSVTEWSDGVGTLVVWDWSRAETFYHLSEPVTLFACEFSPDGRYLAVGHPDASVTVHDLRSRSIATKLDTASAPISLAFAPSGRHLAVNCKEAFCTEVWDWEAETREHRLEHPSDIFSVAWSHSGDQLAVVEGFTIYVWDLQVTPPRPWRVLTGHTWVVSELAFHPNDRLFYSHCWREGKTRVWDLASGTQRLICDGYLSRINDDGSRMGFRTPDSVGVWNVSAGSTVIWPYGRDEVSPRADFADFSEDGRWMLTAGDRGVDLWETSTWRRVSQLRDIYAHAAVFARSDAGILIAQRSGLSSHPVRWNDEGPRLGPGTVIDLPDGTQPYRISQDRSGEWIGVDLFREPDLTPTGTALLIRRPAGATRRLRGPNELRYVAIGPDGRYVASGTWQGDGVTIWDVATGRLVKELDAGGSASIGFSPDGRWLATSSISSIRLWDADAWTPLWQVPCASVIGRLAFSPDGQTLATMTSGSNLQLLDVTTGSSLVTLETNEDPAYVQDLSFHPDGERLAVSYGGDGIRIWDLGHIRRSLTDLGLGW